MGRFQAFAGILLLLVAAVAGQGQCPTGEIIRCFDNVSGTPVWMSAYRKEAFDIACSKNQQVASCLAPYKGRCAQDIDRRTYESFSHNVTTEICGPSKQDFIKHSACVTNSMLLITIAMKCAGIRDAITGLGSIQDAAEKYQKTCKLNSQLLMCTFNETSKACGQKAATFQLKIAAGLAKMQQGRTQPCPTSKEVTVKVPELKDPEEVIKKFQCFSSGVTKCWAMQPEANLKAWSQERAYEATCKAYTNMLNCMGQYNKLNCNEFIPNKMIFEAANSLYDYLCKDGKPAFTEYYNCIRQEKVLDASMACQKNLKLQNITDYFQRNQIRKNEYCKVMEDTQRCALSAVNRECGLEQVVYVMKLAEKMNAAFGQSFLNCPDVIPRLTKYFTNSASNQGSNNPAVNGAGSGGNPTNGNNSPQNGNNPQTGNPQSGSGNPTIVNTIPPSGNNNPPNGNNNPPNGNNNPSNGNNNPSNGNNNPPNGNNNPPNGNNNPPNGNNNPPNGNNNPPNGNNNPPNGNNNPPNGNNNPPNGNNNPPNGNNNPSNGNNNSPNTIPTAITSNPGLNNQNTGNNNGNPGNQPNGNNPNNNPGVSPVNPNTGGTGNNNPVNTRPPLNNGNNVPVAATDRSKNSAERYSTCYELLSLTLFTILVLL